MRIGRAWDKEDRTRAFALRDEGKSFRQIGEALGRTRNAILGFFHRDSHEGARRQAHEAAAAAAAPFEQGTVTLVDLGDCDCRWPYGQPGSREFRYCGRPAAAGAPYCQAHRKISCAHPD